MIKEFFDDVPQEGFGKSSKINPSIDIAFVHSRVPGIHSPSSLKVLYLINNIYLRPPSMGQFSRVKKQYALKIRGKLTLNSTVNIETKTILNWIH